MCLNYGQMPIKRKNKKGALQNKWFEETVKQKMGVVFINAPDGTKDVFVPLNDHNSKQVEDHLKQNNNYNGGLTKLVFDYYCNYDKTRLR